MKKKRICIDYGISRQITHLIVNQILVKQNQKEKKR